MTVETATLERPWAASQSLAAYWELTKPRITALILMSTLVGFSLASAGSPNLRLLAHALLGTALVASGTATLNQYWEREADAKMFRTKDRPVPTGRISPLKALWFGVALSVAGVLYLGLFTNPLASLLAAVTLCSYLFIYTPMKQRTPLCTAAGAFPGALPPLIGWAAARGEITAAAGILYLILFLWQFPHFLAIAWLYREDYARGGIVMLPVVEPDGKSTARQSMIYCAALLPVSLAPSFMGLTGSFYFAGALLLGLGFLHFAGRAATAKTKFGARRLLQASVIYLPLIYALMVFDKAR